MQQRGQAQPASALRPLALRHRAGSPFVSYLGIKSHYHSAGQPAGDASGPGPSSQQHGPALFVAGLPHGFSEAAVAEAFRCFGDVERVVLHHSKTSCIVVFSEQEGRDGALRAAASGQILEYSPPEEGGAVGLKAWVHEHKAKRPGNEQLQQQLDDWTDAHEAEEERKRIERERAMAGDGWTVVVRTKGRKRAREGDSGAATVSGGMAKSVAEAMAVAQAKKATKHGDFYRFQQRQRRRDELLTLQQQFEADRRRVVELRALRNFKPM